MIRLDWSLAAAAVVFLITLWALNRLLFQPLLDTLARRRAGTVDLEAAAAESVTRHEQLFEQYSERVRQEKQRGYQLAETARQEAMEHRQQRLAEARQRAEALLSEARSEMDREIEKAEAGLRSEAEELAILIAGRALQRV